MQYWPQNSLPFKLGQLCTDLLGRVLLKHKPNWELTFLGEKRKIQFPGQGMNLLCSDALPMCEEEEGVEQGWVKGSVVWGVKSLPFSRTTRMLRDQHLPRAALAKSSAPCDQGWLWEAEMRGNRMWKGFLLGSIFCLSFYVCFHLFEYMHVNRAGPQPPMPEMKNNKNIFT